MYCVLYNVNNVSAREVIVPELTDWLWHQGYRLSKYVPNLTGAEYLLMNETLRQFQIAQYEGEL